MNSNRLLRLAGAAALTGGGLRLASSFPLPLQPVELEALWTVIDIFLTFGLIGLYLVRAEKLALLGLASFAIAMAALSFIGGPDADPFGFSTYREGAAVLLIALVGLSIAWIGSAVAGGVLTALPDPLPRYGFVAAGVLFALGFVAAGWDLLRRPALPEGGRKAI